MPSAYQIVVNTPLWVWPLMLFVLWLGWRGLQPRVMPPARLAILPLISLGTSLAGIAQSLQPGLALAGWAAALPRVAVPSVRAGGALAAEDPAGRGRRLVHLGFGVSIFAVRYTLGVLSGVMPACAPSRSGSSCPAASAAPAPAAARLSPGRGES